MSEHILCGGASAVRAGVGSLSFISTGAHHQYLVRQLRAVGVRDADVPGLLAQPGAAEAVIADRWDAARQPPDTPPPALPADRDPATQPAETPDESRRFRPEHWAVAITDKGQWRLWTLFQGHWRPRQLLSMPRGHGDKSGHAETFGRAMALYGGVLSRDQSLTLFKNRRRAAQARKHFVSAVLATLRGVNCLKGLDLTGTMVIPQMESDGTWRAAIHIGYEVPAGKGKFTFRLVHELSKDDRLDLPQMSYDIRDIEPECHDDDEC